MSLLMVVHEPEGVLVLTDTLATTVEGVPYLYVSKCAIVPHLSMVMAGTGIAQLPNIWHARVMDSLLCRDIDMLDAFAPEVLREVWASDLGMDGTAEGTATIYHFGRSEERGEYVGYAYRSTDNFVSESLVPGFRVKPPPLTDMPEGPPETLEEMVALACRIRGEQDLMPRNERVYVGGELVLTAMRDGTINLAKIHQWPDFEEMWLGMNDRLRQGIA